MNYQADKNDFVLVCVKIDFLIVGTILKNDKNPEDQKED